MAAWKGLLSKELWKEKERIGEITQKGGDVRMPRINWKGITSEDVLKAIEIFEAESPEYPSPKSTFLIKLKFQQKLLSSKKMHFSIA